MTDVLVGLQVCFHDQADAHRVRSQLSDVDGSLYRASELQLVRFDRNDLHEWHLFDQHFWLLIVKAVFFNTPSSSFNVQSLHVGTLVQSLGDLRCIEDRGDVCVHG